MIAQSYISENLRTLNRNYNKPSTTPKYALFYSKLAILELCGWIEETMDDIVTRCARRQLQDGKNRKYCATEIVKRTYGFDYHNNFREMLIQLLGLVNVEYIEKKVDPAKFASMTAALGALKAQRDAEAHTHVKGVTRKINAPSATLAQFTPVFEGLAEFDRILRKYW
jgi:hypothetical protein